MKKIMAVLLCAAMIFGLCACTADGSQTDEDSTVDMSALLADAVALAGDVYLGEGLKPVVPDDAVIDSSADFAYFPTADEKYTSIAAIKAETERYFTFETASTWLYPDAFEGDIPLYKEDNGVLYVDLFGGPLTSFGVEWVYESFKIISKTESSATATITKLINNYEEITVTVEFKKTDAGWRIDSRLY